MWRIKILWDFKNKNGSPNYDEINGPSANEQNEVFVMNGFFFFPVNRKAKMKESKKSTNSRTLPEN